MKNRKYHYEYFLYTNNLCWGHKLLGKGRSPGEARIAAGFGSFGATVMEKHRVYD